MSGVGVYMGDAAVSFVMRSRGIDSHGKISSKAA